VQSGSAADLNKTQGEAGKTQQRQSDKRKADTECHNKEFDQLLIERYSRGPIDFKHENIQRVHSMCSGRPLPERL
jgi:hypothetical protein